ncbi:MAG: endonuclease/exonuclease/phosphatase family protein [Syntrophobacteria bacterium]
MQTLIRTIEAVEKTVPLLTVASYNIRRCVGTDGRRDPERTVQVLRELDVQVIGLQEVHWKSSDMDFMAKAAGLAAIPGPTMQRSPGFYGNVLLTGCRVNAVRRLDLTVPGKEPRGGIDATLDVQGISLRIIATHLGLRTSERRYQLGRLLNALDSGNEELTVLLGDINEWFPLSRTLRPLHTRLGRPPALPTFPSWFPLLPLDRIWVQPREALANLCVHRTPLARVASDHLPLKAHIAVH